MCEKLASVEAALVVDDSCAAGLEDSSHHQSRGNVGVKKQKPWKKRSNKIYERLFVLDRTLCLVMDCVLLEQQRQA